MKQNESIDYEIKYNLKEKHNELLRILDEFDTICRNNGIKYSLSYGTLLGAIRHAGFIPWDDDADLMMTREEYNKLLALPTQNATIEIIKTTFLDRISIKTNNPKRLYVDLFLLDFIPKSNFKYKLKRLFSIFLRCYFVNKKQLQDIKNKYSFFKRIPRFFVWLCSFVVGRVLHLVFWKKSIFKYHDRKISSVRPGESNKMKTMTDELSMMKKYTFSSELFDSYRDEVFCGRKYMCISKSKEYLTYVYGDFMTLPNEEDRHPDSHISLSEDKVAEKFSRIIRII